MLAIILGVLVCLYGAIAWYALEANNTGKRVLRRGVWAGAVRPALEAAGWPLVVLPWRELPSWLRTQWLALEPRYAAIP